MKGLDVTDFDADEPVQPLSTAQLAKKQARRTDKMLAVAGILLAGAAAAFPWYVFFNEDKFGIRIAGWEQLRDLSPESAARRPFSVAPRPKPDLGPQMASQKNPLDDLVTATVPKAGPIDKTAGMTGELQPLPGSGGFHLLHVVNGRALVEDARGMYMVQVGSILPDNSRLAVIEQRDGKWVIVSSTGAIYSEPK